MEKNMNENFKKLNNRVVDSLNDTDLEKLNYLLSKIKDPTLVSGVGGSSIVASFASKILLMKNLIITKCVEPRDLKYFKEFMNGYKNILACSYSGANFGVELAFDNNLRHYLLSSKENNENGIISLNYVCKDPEKSFISLAATLIPCAILLNYYLDNDYQRIIDSTKEYDYNFDVNCDAFEIFTGFETLSASKYLESTMVEAGIGIPVIHDKYSYCHGRSTLGINYNSIAIYYNRNTKFDLMMLEELKKYYSIIITIDSKFKDQILDDFQMLIQSMYLTKYIAEKKLKDLSKVEYSPIVKKLYKYSGRI